MTSLYRKLRRFLYRRSILKRRKVVTIIGFMPRTTAERAAGEVC